MLSLTSLRAIGAFAVAIHHFGNIWPLCPPVNFISQIGWLGVTLFFILSGFVLMWSYDKDKEKGWGLYVLRRLSRIYPLHLLCLVISLVAYYLFNNPLAGYVGTFWGTIANLFLVQDWGLGNPEIRQAWNGVSWTLSCELFFYLCAPFIFNFLISKKVSQGLKLAVFFWGIVGSLSWYASLFPLSHHWKMVADWNYFSPVSRIWEFIVGAVGARLIQSGWRPGTPTFAVLVMFIPLLIYCFGVREDLRVSAWMSFLFIPGSFLLICSLARQDLDGKGSWIQGKWIVLLGEVSYAYYIIHAIWLGVFVLIIKNYFHGHSLTSTLCNGFLLIIFVVSTIPLAMGLHFWFEMPVRRFFLKNLKLRQSALP